MEVDGSERTNEVEMQYHLLIAFHARCPLITAAKLPVCLQPISFAIASSDRTWDMHNGTALQKHLADALTYLGPSQAVQQQSRRPRLHQ